MHVKSKGSAGEREFANILQDIFPKLEISRNIDQVRDGGADIIAVEPFAVEVKRCQTLLINNWRKQAVSQVTKRNPIPVIAYRQNRRQWRIQLPVNAIVKKRYKHKHRNAHDVEWMEVSLNYFKLLVVAVKGGAK
jgi:Holliday junction resolvase